MDWGFQNPNKTAMLIVLMMFASLLLIRRGRWGLLAAAGLLSGLGALMLHTYSRGAVVALIAGMLWVFAVAGRELFQDAGRKIIVICSMLFLVIYGTVIEFNERLIHGLASKDLSVSNRFVVWRQVPNMIWSSPSGWGRGNSGVVYNQFFQENQTNAKYRTLLGSHWTWMAEYGWMWSLGYLAFWTLTLLLCLPQREQAWEMSVIGGLWVAFGAGAAFSSVAEEWILWILPLLGLGWVVWQRFRTSQWPRRRHCFIAAAALPVVFGSFLLVGQATPPGVPVKGGQKSIMIGGGVPSVCLYQPDTTIVGANYGHDLRAWVSAGEASESLTVEQVNAPDGFSQNHYQLGVFSGNAIPPKEIEFERMIFLNPTFHPVESNLSARSAESTVIFGFYHDHSSRARWEDFLLEIQISPISSLPE